MALALTAGLLVAGAVYLFSSRELMRVLLGFVLISHAANLILLAAGGIARRGEPFGTPGDEAADPLPQAFVLTAIVIAFAITVVLLVLAATGRGDGDRIEPGPEDHDSDDTDDEDDDMHAPAEPEGALGEDVDEELDEAQGLHPQDHVRRNEEGTR